MSQYTSYMCYMLSWWLVFALLGVTAAVFQVISYPVTSCDGEGLGVWVREKPPGKVLLEGRAGYLGCPTKWFCKGGGGTTGRGVCHNNIGYSML